MTPGQWRAAVLVKEPGTWRSSYQAMIGAHFGVRFTPRWRKWCGKRRQEPVWLV